MPSYDFRLRTHEDDYKYIPRVNDSEMLEIKAKIVKMKEIIRARLDEDSADRIISTYLDEHLGYDMNSLYQKVMLMVPAMTVELGFQDGLKVSQDLKNVLKMQIR